MGEASGSQPVPEPLRLIGPIESQPMPPVERRIGFVVAEVLEILLAARRQECRKVSCSTVVDVVTKGV